MHSSKLGEPFILNDGKQKSFLLDLKCANFLFWNGVEFDENEVHRSEHMASENIWVCMVPCSPCLPQAR